MNNNSKGSSKEYDSTLARPYVNDQVLKKVYNLPTALKKGTLFPELFLIDSEMYNADLYKNPKNRVKGRR